MAAGRTYTPIATTTLTSAQASVTFSSISGSYTDLVLVCNHAGVSSLNSLYTTLNGDTASNYSYTFLSGNGTSAISGRGSVTSLPFGNSSLTNGATISIINFMNYSNTTTYKTVIGRNGVADGSQPNTTATVGLWRNTNAINSILISYYNVNFTAGSTFTLYGIAAA